MNIIKITVFQKNINTDISRDQKQKLISQKSDFLILPRFFPTIAKVSEKSSIHNYKIYVDKLLEISEYYKGIIIGGTILREVNGKLYESCPIIQDINVIDWYDARVPEKMGDLPVTPGESESIFILGGVRFAILIGNESKNENYLSHIHSEKVDLLLNSASIYNSDSEPSEYLKDLDLYSEYSKNYSLNIVRASGIGRLFNNKELSGRSFYSSNTGVKWKVASFENQNEIIKTVNINVLDTIHSLTS
ncbi:MAG: amidohydrolase [Leptospiraceae bacterium]|nr:amidohydrolase [Leptospiraceae bacterium]